MRELVNFNENAYQRGLAELTNKVESYNRALKQVIDATEGAINTISVRLLENYAKEVTSFKNASIGLDALDLKDVHSLVRSAQALDLENEPYVNIKKGKATVDSEGLKELYSTYFDEKHTDLIKSIEKLIESSKEIPPYILQNALTVSRNGMYCDKSRLNSVLKMMSR